MGETRLGSIFSRLSDLCHPRLKASGCSQWSQISYFLQNKVQLHHWKQISQIFPIPNWTPSMDFGPTQPVARVRNCLLESDLKQNVYDSIGYPEIWYQAKKQRARSVIVTQVSNFDRNRKALLRFQRRI